MALLWDDGILIEPMMDWDRLTGWLHTWKNHIDLAVIEEPGMRPGQATQTAMKVGRGVGIIQGLLMGLIIPQQMIRPQSWSASFPHGVVEKDPAKRYRLIKEARREIVQKLFPKIDFRASERCKTAHSGMVDAALIAVHVSRQRNNYGQEKVESS